MPLTERQATCAHTTQASAAEADGMRAHRIDAPGRRARPAPKFLQAVEPSARIGRQPGQRVFAMH